MISVLYVDDEPDLLDIGKLFLERAGLFTVDTFESATEALLQMNTERYDAIISDYQMPEMDGIAFLKQLKASGNTIPFIIFTGRGREEVVIEALNEGADFYIQKGGEPESQFAELSNKIRYAVSRKQSEEALKESEDRYRKLVEISPDAIILHRDGKIAYMNPAALTLIGASHSDEVIGKNLLDYIHPDSVDAVKTNIQKDLAGERTSSMELPMLRLDGTSIIVEGRGARTFIDGNPAVQVAIRDITERRRAEEAIRQANRKLNLLNSITRHDVANQLTLLQGFAQIAAMKNPDPVVADFLSKIDATAQTIARQIEFTKTYQNLGIHTPAWFRLDDTIAKEGREEVKVSNTCRNIEVFADPMLERVFFNIFENAIQHGRRVTEIAVRCERAPDGLVVIIEDDGVGIPPEEKEKIFEKGYGKNTGFGLFLTKEILSITGITIRETGEPGKGAQFEITVPKDVWRLAESVRKGDGR